jgi:hypothetical protein
VSTSSCGGIQLIGPFASIAQTENGWTSDFVGWKWLEKSFIPQVRAKEPDPNQWILLVVDGHGSHVIPEFTKIAHEHRIHIFQLPAHTTHKLQPLDVGCFGPFKRAWADRCEEVVEKTGGMMPRANFVKEYLAVREASMTEAVVKAAFRKTGLWEFNRNIFDVLEFAPSHTTSTSAHLPSSFPQALDLLPDDETEDDLDSMGGLSDELEDQLGSAGELNDSDGQEQAGIMHENAGRMMDEDSGIQDGRAFEIMQTMDGGSDSPGNESLPSTPILRQSQFIHATNDTTPPPLAPELSAPSAPSMPSEGVMPLVAASLVVPTTLAKPAASPILRTHVGRGATSRDRYSALEKDYFRVCNLYSEAVARSEAAETHCAMAGLEIGTLKHMVNAKADREAHPTRKLKMKAGLLTSAEGMVAYAAQEREDEKKKQEDMAKAVEEVQKREGNSVRRHALITSNEPFDGRLSKKKRSDWEDIAHVLNVKYEKVNVSDLIVAITVTLRSRPDLQASPRFWSLWQSLSQRGAPPIAPVSGDARVPSLVVVASTAARKASSSSLAPSSSVRRHPRQRPVPVSPYTVVQPVDKPPHLLQHKNNSETRGSSERSDFENITIPSLSAPPTTPRRRTYVPLGLTNSPRQFQP